tara:strand:- start:692 stop:1375 length:684 start_codon:yes stop_codon:yes gene_type:complete
MKKLIVSFITIMWSMGTWANDIYVTQSGATLDLDITQDGSNNTVGNSTTASSVIGATTNLDIDQIGDSNVLTFDVNGATYTGTFSVTGNSNNIDFKCDSDGTGSSCATVTSSVTMVGNSNDIDIDVGETADAAGSAVTITSAASDDSNVIAATVDGTSAILTITVDGDTNNWLVDIDGNGDVNGHTYIHTHTGGIADVDVVQSGVNDNMVTLTTSGDNHDIDISQTD